MKKGPDTGDSRGKGGEGRCVCVCVCADLPNGPAWALLRQRTVQILPVEPKVVFFFVNLLVIALLRLYNQWDHRHLPPMHVKFVGRLTVILKSISLFWDSPLLPGMLFVTLSGVWPVSARPLLVGSKSHCIHTRQGRSASLSHTYAHTHTHRAHRSREDLLYSTIGWGMGKR